MLPAAVGHVAGAHQTGPHAAAHPLLHRHLAGDAKLLRYLRHVPQHGLGAAGQHSVIAPVLRQLPADQGIHKAVMSQRAVISGAQNLGAVLPEEIL